ncbi:MAG: (2Fe-2S)-binding protein [Alphaproteobacteria bacterium]
MSEETIALRFRLNGAERAVSVAANRNLADLLRDEFGLTGTKIGCDQGVCGACTVLVDGAPVASCATFAWQADGRTLLTIEGLSVNGKLDPVQEAFKANSAFQCGYCTPGMILLGKALLDRHPDPDRATIKDWMQSNICRCTGYQMIVEAIENAARRRREAPR